MNVTQSGASRSRDVAPTRVFFPVPANLDITSERTPPASVYGWKRGYSKRIWATDGPDGVAARGVLAVLWEHSDDDGRTWIGLRRLAAEAGLGNLRTVRNALGKLAQGGWLRFTPQTWASLTAEQNAARRPTPRRGDLGQATHLYEILDRRVKPTSPAPMGSPTPTRPGIVRTSTPSSEGSADETPGQNCPGGLEQNCPGGPGAKLLHDPDPVELTPRKEREERVALVIPDTPHFSQARESQEGGAWLVAWNVLVHVHAEKTKGVYGIAPLPPDLKRDQCQAVAECLEGAAVELAAKLRARGGMERELVQVRQDLAGRVMSLYFKRDNEHLRRVKHALRDLPREFHARITEAVQGILRESHDAQSPRQTVVLEQEKPVTVKAEKASKSWVEMDAARRQAEQELGKIFGAPLRPTSRPNLEPKAEKRENVSLREIRDAASSAPNERAKAEATPERPKAPEPPRSQEREIAPQTVQRSIGRPGAPRWGALGPTPAKVRRVSRLQIAEPEEATESADPHQRE